MTAETKVLIIGAGIGGLMLGLLLERANINYHILEKTSEIRPIGSALTLNATVLGLFDQLGLLEKIRQFSKPVNVVSLVNGKGDLLTNIDLSRSAERCGYPALAMARPDLHSLLFSQIPTRKIEFSRKFISYQESSTEVIVHCTSSTTCSLTSHKNQKWIYRASILIGADGAYSKVRQNLFQNLERIGLLPDSDALPLRLESVCLVGVTDSIPVSSSFSSSSSSSSPLLAPSPNETTISTSNAGIKTITEQHSLLDITQPPQQQQNYCDDGQQIMKTVKICNPSNYNDNSNCNSNNKDKNTSGVNQVINNTSKSYQPNNQKSKRTKCNKNQKKHLHQTVNNTNNVYTNNNKDTSTISEECNNQNCHCRCHNSLRLPVSLTSPLTIQQQQQQQQAQFLTPPPTPTTTVISTSTSTSATTTPPTTPTTTFSTPPTPFEHILTSPFAEFRIVTGAKELFTWGLLSIPNNKICWMIGSQDPELLSKVRQSWTPTTTTTSHKTTKPTTTASNNHKEEEGDPMVAIQEMIDRIKDLPCPYSGETLSTVLSFTPLEKISKIAIQEKNFQTWYDGRIGLLGDSCHKTSPSGGQGAVQAILDAICLANLWAQKQDPIQHDLSIQEITEIFEDYVQDRQLMAKLAVDGSRLFGKFFYKSSNRWWWWGIDWSRWIRGMNWIPGWISRQAADFVGWDRPQACFLPFVKDSGTLERKPQVQLKSAVGSFSVNTL